MKEKIKNNKMMILLIAAIVFLVIVCIIVFLPGKEKNTEKAKNSKKEETHIVGVVAQYQMDPATKIELSVSEDSSFLCRKTFYDKSILKNELSEEELKEYEDKTVYYTYNYLPAILAYVQDNILNNEEELKTYKVETSNKETSVEEQNAEQAETAPGLWSVTITTQNNMVTLASNEEYPSFWFGLLTIFKEDYMKEQESVKNRDYTKMMYDHLGEPDREVLRIHYLKAEEYVNEHLDIKDGDICVNLFADDPIATSSYKYFSMYFTQALNKSDSICTLKPVKKAPEFDYDLKLEGYDTIYLVKNDESEFEYDFYMKENDGLSINYYKATIDASEPENNDYQNLLTDFNEVKKWITVPCIEYYKHSDDGNPQMVSEPYTYTITETQGSGDGSDAYFDNLIVFTCNNDISEDDIAAVMTDKYSGKIIAEIPLDDTHKYYLYMMEERFVRGELNEICDIINNATEDIVVNVISKGE